jgi:uncharacterized repeat protein (TIGR03803 family)
MLYGTAQTGGAYGYGVIYTIGSGGAFTILHSFDYTDGGEPGAALVQGTDGDFYGTTIGGGAQGDGTVFRITPAGTLTTLHSFHVTDGATPNGGLIQGTDGNFYGTTEADGANSSGTIFQITPAGTLTTLHSFSSSEGQNPWAGLVQHTDGNFFGTTWGGGSSNMGTVFRLSMGLGPFVRTIAPFGKVGEAVTILGTDLTGATSVTFNGTPASFTVVSPSAITTAVPAGATSGTIQVVTPAGTLSSNVPFQVL